MGSSVWFFGCIGYEFRDKWRGVKRVILHTRFTVYASEINSFIFSRPILRALMFCSR